MCRGMQRRLFLFALSRVFFSPPLQGEGWVGMVLVRCLVFGVWFLIFCSKRNPTDVPVSLTGHPGRRVTFSCLWDSFLFFWFVGLQRCVRTDLRPCESYRPSWPARYFLLLVQEKVTKENTPSVPRRRCAPVRYGRPGFCRQSIHGLRQKRRDPSRRRARCAGLIRPPFAASQRDPRSRATLLLRQGLPPSALPGSLSAAARARRK